MNVSLLAMTKAWHSAYDVCNRSAGRTCRDFPTQAKNATLFSKKHVEYQSTSLSSLSLYVPDNARIKEEEVIIFLY